MKTPKTTKYDLTQLGAAYDQSKPEFHAPRGNSKLGSIPAFNLLPVLTCSAEACKSCAKEGCYAVKNAFAHGYNYDTNNVLKAWADNTRLAKSDVETLEKHLDAYLSIMELSIASCKFFRIHSAGDFFSVEYAQMWRRLAEKHSGIRFLAFTKQWEIVRQVSFAGLENFSLVLSGWTGCTIPEDLASVYPCALCIEAGEEEPADAIPCPGTCESCGMCWGLKKTGKNVFFHKH